jgi:outer membrane immunogenic protein
MNNKTTLTLILLSIYCSFSANAQVYIGARAGLNISNLVTDANVISKKSKIGFQAGIVGCGVLKNDLSWQAEVNYAQKGFKSSNVKANMAYLELPILAKLYFPLPTLDKEKIKGFINLGPYLGYWMSNKSTYTAADGSSVTSTSFASSSKKFEFGYLLGAGVSYTLGPGYLLGELRYQFALTNTSSEVDYSRNRVFSINASYIVPMSFFKKKPAETDNMKKNE